MDDTPNLTLPYIMPAQAQKHVTHNEALRALDCIVQLSVMDRDLSAPPSSPADGARYIVAGSPSGAWSGHTNDVAAWQDGAWAFYTPAEGWVAWVRDEDSLLAWDGSNWVVAGGGGGGSVNPVAMVGVNATADAVNKLSVKSDVVLLSHDDVTPGTGDQRTIVNKAATGKTASHLFQTGFSGRAEFGLTGDDDFHVKVSPNGSTWFEAMVVDRSTGKVRFPTSGSREVLTAARTYYVRTDGSDGNDGRTNAAGGAFASLQKAIDVVAALDISIYDVTIKLGNTGTFTGGMIVQAPWVGTGNVTLEGDTSTPSNTVVTSSSGNGGRGTVVVTNGGRLRVKHFRIGCTSSGSAFQAYGGGIIKNLGGVDFAACAFAHWDAREGGLIHNDYGAGAYTISGGAHSHFYGESGGLISLRAMGVTLSGTPAFSAAFAVASQAAAMNVDGISFVGAATGTRYVSTLNGVVNVGGAGANYFPGNAAGSTATGGQYA